MQAITLTTTRAPAGQGTITSMVMRTTRATVIRTITMRLMATAMVSMLSMLSMLSTLPYMRTTA